MIKLVGSYTSVVGLPLYETMSLLGGEGFVAASAESGSPIVASALI